MTYQEIKQRLTNCEVKLKEYQEINHPARKSKNFNTTVEKLTLMKESYKKLLKEAEDGMVRTSDPSQAEKLAKKGIKVDLKTEQDGVQFSKEETASIAKEVGKAVAKALHNLGDEIDSMKARNLEPNSFEIYVQYKNDSDDQFSFYITDDTLHLVDFSFDKEIGGVGVKPSGEAIVHVDVLANELVKHFKAQMAEGMSDREYADAKEADRLDIHPEKTTIAKIKALIAAQRKLEEIAPDEEDLYQHDDEYLAQLKRKKAKDESIFDTPRMGGFHSSKGVAGRSPNTHAQDKAYADSNRKAYKKDDDSIDEAPEGKSYIKVAVRDARKALTLIDDNPAYSKAVEMDGSDTYYFTDEELAYDLMMDLQAHGIEVTDNNIDLDENKAHDEGGDLDIGHQDDEPDMLKQQVYDIATYAAKLYKILDKYDQYDGEVDFPHWWQKKIVLARDYVSAAQHYLEFEEKQPAIDALALEENTQKASYNKLKKEYDALVGKMKQLAQHFKTAEGEKKAKIVAALKQHTARKRELEKLIDKTVGGVGVGQELDPNLSELFGPKVSYDEIIGGIITRFNELKKYVSKKEPEAMDDLQQVLRAFEIFDEKMAYGTHEELEEVSEDHTKDPNDKYVVRPCKAKDEPWAVWEGEKRIKGFAKKEDAQAYADKKNKEQGLNEAKATCCGKCGRVHVKGTECKRPFLKGKDHCRYN